jgi:hypothetical protein
MSTATITKTPAAKKKADVPWKLIFYLAIGAFIVAFWQKHKKTIICIGAAAAVAAAFPFLINIIGGLLSVGGTVIAAKIAAWRKSLAKSKEDGTPEDEALEKASADATDAEQIMKEKVGSGEVDQNIPGDVVISADGDVDGGGDTGESVEEVASEAVGE